ncbi:MAG: hypothetical protein ACREQR_17955 [Candidatus Binataceae bacterium]
MHYATAAITCFAFVYLWTALIRPEWFVPAKVCKEVRAADRLR